VIEAEGRRLCHLGDLGHILSTAQIEEIGSIDILMIPVGGTYTITAQEAQQVIRLIKPRVSIPMHYKTEVCKFPISPLQDFARHFGEIIKVPFLELPAGEQISLAEVAVLDYSYIDRSNV
jgi:L-ascorbate metabolism protein UlaG (beta-lactamase superfamily)